MSRAIFFFCITLFLLFCFSCSVKSGNINPESAMNLLAAETKGKSVLMIIANKDFRDEEYKLPHDLLSAMGAKIKVASDSKSEAKGMLGLSLMPDLLLTEVNVNDYDAVIFVGGSGTTVLFGNKYAQAIAKDAYSKGKIIGAICLAPVILANAGILKGKKATIYESEGDLLKAFGAIYTAKQVEKDGLIITAEGPNASKKFGELIVQELYRK